MKAIAQVQSDDRVINQLQSNIIPPLNALVQNSITQGNILTNVSLSVGNNFIPHKLNRPLTGWFLTRKRAAAEVYDNQDNIGSLGGNNFSTLLLVSDSLVNVDIYVF